ncbi:insulin-like growth factor-binding protein complex acid labile subunit [Hetaerina americana]|uniref:insulin-like growth factor-binding protein complex acid labile subunit n=1 Tax=Hetaerina americana TaxID=62018 RepID=UPI003A7F110D
MKVSDMPNKVTMHTSNKNIYGPVFLLLSLLSLGNCRCVPTFPDGTGLLCTDAFPEVASISYDVRHLEIKHVRTLPIVQFSSSYFARNSKLKYLESIHIHNTSLSSVHKNAFGGLKYLDYLDISDNSLLKSFHPESISMATELRILSLSGNVNLFDKISGPILISESLEELDLSRCEIEYLHDDAFSQLKHLTFLNLAYNKLRKIPEDTFSGLHHLIELDLSANLLVSLPKYMLQNNSAVEVLRLRANPIHDIPKEIFSGNSIVYLDLGETESATISIPPMQSLTRLNLGGSLVSSLDDLSGFPNLNHLNLSYTKVTKVDSFSFVNNSNLETFRLSGIPNLSLPHQFYGSFLYVDFVEISNCGLVYLMLDLFKDMKSIVNLNLSHNAFNDSASLGKALSHLRKLEILDLTDNKLRFIEEGDFSGNSFLKKLLLTGNPLVSAPSLSSTPSLAVLDISHCTLTRLHLPAIFRQAPKMQYMLLSHNNLSSLNDEAYLNPVEDEDSPWELPGSLMIFDLRDNPWSCDPSFVSLIHEMSKRGVAPSPEPPQQIRPSEGEGRNLDKEWEELVDEVCEQPHYDVAMTVMPMILPPQVKKTVTAKFPIWLIVGIVTSFVLASAAFLFIQYQRHVRYLRHSKGLIPSNKSEISKINVSLVGSTAGIKMSGRAKDYQRLQEDRSPNSPVTPRIYRPPPNERHFTFPDIPDGKDPESCD